ncbi:hypothetical protein B0I31_102432 [Saccharothrix carnea]|uniref:Uncharacterized protein n=1 Tax=Saccharothrix carnea TaxID=1280637 RepID=A0A2P8IG62_SACCR|nr:hypothetical protein [Saccharothrix carnea]PSL57453.1 hypothetical protein B0I31_102432 [Saccharothrix carnea]
MDVEPNRLSDEDLRRFVLDRLAEDEERLAREELPLLDEAERRGRLAILRSDDDRELLLVPGEAHTQQQHAPVPFAEKARWLRAEVEGGSDRSALLLLAAAYETHHGWQEEWRT